MFTQKISMDCTREQYEKYLKEELLKMGYKEGCQWWGRDIGVFTNACNGNTGIMLDICKVDKEAFNRHYLGSFNAPLFLALAAMTDKAEGNYGEYVIGLNTGAFHRMNKDDRILPEYKFVRKATKEEIMARFGEKKCNHNTPENIKEVTDRLCNDINEFDGDRIREYIDYFFSRSIDESDAINLLKSKGYKILKPKTWEEI